ncbi:hypothetical protein Pla52o_01080 [Novipirellula galeiformis]|uniref:Uncharacterized protein n=1 Tax=Novipirellula galeiformis TaxID=2528004 RepID=A0A5C6CQU1_9BACT|nr:hypothetical protein Pla52o_01080 [Novipirellula galeiformis]
MEPLLWRIFPLIKRPPIQSGRSLVIVAGGRRIVGGMSGGGDVAR